MVAMSTENHTNPPSLESISQDLDALKTARAKQKPEAHVPAGAARGAVDFLSALAVCSLLGYAVDYFAHSFPWGMLVGLLAGVGVGTKMMLRDAAADTEKK